MLRVQCENCGHQFKAGEEFAGRTAKCRRCGNVLRILDCTSRSSRKHRSTQVPLVRNVEIKKTVLGKYVAAYKCPHCESPLRSTEHELQGESDLCPYCNMRFRVSEEAIVTIECRKQQQQAEKDRKLEEKRDAKLAVQVEFLKAARTEMEREKQQREGRRQLYESQKVARNGPEAVVSEPRFSTDTVTCPFCREQILAGAIKCKHCGSNLGASEKSDLEAGCLGLFLGPVGLWYKGQWAAGFAWLAMAILIGIASGGLLVPFLWIGMAIHAASAKPKG